MKTEKYIYQQTQIPKSEHPDQWDGLNLLGFALMEVRDEMLGVI